MGHTFYYSLSEIDSRCRRNPTNTDPTSARSHAANNRDLGIILPCNDCRGGTREFLHSAMLGLRAILTKTRFVALGKQDSLPSVPSKDPNPPFRARNQAPLHPLRAKPLPICQSDWLRITGIKVGIGSNNEEAFVPVQEVTSSNYLAPESWVVPLERQHMIELLRTKSTASV
jgi:hypothetical protein